MSNNRRKRMKKLRQKWSQKFTSFISSKKSNSPMISSPHARARGAPKPVKPAAERDDNQLALSEVASPRSEEIDLENEISTLT